MFTLIARLIRGPVKRIDRLTLAELADMGDNLTLPEARALLAFHEQARRLEKSLAGN